MRTAIMTLAASALLAGSAYASVVPVGEYQGTITQTTVGYCAKLTLHTSSGDLTFAVVNTNTNPNAEQRWTTIEETHALEQLQGAFGLPKTQLLVVVASTATVHCNGEDFIDYTNADFAGQPK